MNAKNKINEINGILVVDKDKGWTSHDVVALVRKRFSFKKVGHAGTLDPNATGVLVLLVGKATKLSNTYLNDDKEYVAEMKLGERTASGDSDGDVTLSRDVTVDEEEIRDVMSRFVGVIEQVPPMVSAKKVNGKKLYELARKGVEVKRDPVSVEIKELELIKVDIPHVVFRVVCSKGTYIRQLADDMGEELGCGAHLTELRRTRSGEFSIDGAVTVPEIKDMDPEKLYESISRI